MIDSSAYAQWWANEPLYKGVHEHSHCELWMYHHDESHPHPDDPALAAWVRASTDDLPDGEDWPPVDPATQAAMAQAVEDFAAAMDRGEVDHGEEDR